MGKQLPGHVVAQKVVCCRLLVGVTTLMLAAACSVPANQEDVARLERKIMERMEELRKHEESYREKTKSLGELIEKREQLQQQLKEDERKWRNESEAVGRNALLLSLGRPTQQDLDNRNALIVSSLLGSPKQDLARELLPFIQSQRICYQRSSPAAIEFLQSHRPELLNRCQGGGENKTVTRVFDSCQRISFPGQPPTAACLSRDRRRFRVAFAKGGSLWLSDYPPPSTGNNNPADDIDHDFCMSLNKWASCRVSCLRRQGASSLVGGRAEQPPPRTRHAEGRDELRTTGQDVDNCISTCDLRFAEKHPRGRGHDATAVENMGRIAGFIAPEPGTYILHVSSPGGIGKQGKKTLVLRDLHVEDAKPFSICVDMIRKTRIILDGFDTVVVADGHLSPDLLCKEKMLCLGKHQ